MIMFNPWIKLFATFCIIFNFIFSIELNSFDNQQQQFTDFNHISKSILSDGEVTIKVRYNNLTGIKTMIQNYRLQQITDGQDIIQMWFIDNQLVDCEYGEDGEAINRLINQVKSSARKLSTSEPINETCYDLITTEFANGEKIQLLRPEAKFITQRKQLINQCNQLQKVIRQRLKSKRWKRADLVTFPGTNWCGKGTTSNQFKQLGRRSTTDRCCRDHDHCKYTILPLTRKYHLFNYRLYVISHCDCDERFRSCLRISNTGSSNLVGKMFFNIVQTKCFIFKKEPTCKRRSWWGKCTKMGKIRKAIIKDGLNY